MVNVDKEKEFLSLMFVKSLQYNYHHFKAKSGKNALLYTLYKNEFYNTRRSKIYDNNGAKDKRHKYK